MQVRRVRLALATSWVVFEIAIVVMLGSLAFSASAKTIHMFPHPVSGKTPIAPLVSDASGNLYGTTPIGGLNNFGVVFELVHESSGWRENVLYTFKGGTDGAQPRSGLILDSTGNLYGTTQGGGVACGGLGCGTVFELVPNDGKNWTEKILYSFSGGNDGAGPTSNLVLDQAGNFFGTTTVGGGTGCGGSGCGTVFKLTPSGDNWTETVLYSFAGGTDGANPSSGLVLDTLGNLYGTTYVGGSNICNGNSGCGTVFELTPRGGSWIESVLVSFTGSNGAFPNSGVILSNSGNLYGTTVSGGSGVGTIFGLAPGFGGGGWSESVLYNFTGNDDGKSPKAGLTTDAAGNLYATSSAGGSEGCNGGGCGAILELTPVAGGWTPNVLYTFTGQRDGGSPQAALCFDKDGNLDGTASIGGNGGLGVAFQLSPGGNEWKESVLHAFSQADGSSPASGVIRDSVHNLYGTTSIGGGHGAGTVFRLAPKKPAGWAESVLYSFKGGSDGATPSRLTLDRTGNLYGTTLLGGQDNAGTIFRLSPKAGGWTETVLYSFTGGVHGGSPSSGVIIDAAGNLYGTASAGRHTEGVVFKLTHSKSGWVQTVLYSFCPKQHSCHDGSGPYGGLIFDSSGNLYGTTSVGGIHDEGTVFELTPGSNGKWSQTVLHSFTGDSRDGGRPQAELVIDSSGNLYGTTTVGGTANQGTVFKLEAGSWNESTLHSFGGDSDGQVPFGGLVFDSVGNIYGSTLYGGLADACSGLGCGTVFELSPTKKGNWMESVLYSFTGGNDGAFPSASLTVNGRNLFGTAQRSGNGEGVVFKINH